MPSCGTSRAGDFLPHAPWIGALPRNPPKEISFSLGTHDRCFDGGIDHRAFMPFGNQIRGVATPEPPAGISRLQPTKAVPWNPS